MSEFDHGDLIEAVKGEDVIRGRGWWDCSGPMMVGASGCSTDGLVARGYTVRTIEKRKIPLPTEPGTVIAIGEWWLVRLRPYTPNVPASWELLPAPHGRAEDSMAHARVKAQCVYSDEWVQAEVDQDRDGFRIISAPIKEEDTK